ncbi:MAG TPA: hypothetical protein VF158_08495 [Longimicrobiales bacterium]
MRRVVRYAPLAVHEWAQLRSIGGRPLAPDPALGSAFIPLFDSLEELRRYHPDAEVMEVESVVREPAPER